MENRRSQLDRINSSHVQELCRLNELLCGADVDDNKLYDLWVDFCLDHKKETLLLLRAFCQKYKLGFFK